MSDRPGKDIHTPKDGFWWSHMGWIVCEMTIDNETVEERYAPELVADPVHRFLNKVHILPNIILGLAFYAIARLAARGLGHLRPPRGRPARDLVRELRRPHLRLPHLRHARGLDQLLVGRASWPGARAGTTTTTRSSAPRATATNGGRSTRPGWSSARWPRSGLAKDIQLLPRSADRFRIGRERTDADMAPIDLFEADAEPIAAGSAA